MVLNLAFEPVIFDVKILVPVILEAEILGKYSPLPVSDWQVILVKYAEAPVNVPICASLK